MEFFKTCEGIPVYITDCGKGDKVVVFLHGYLETSEVWATYSDFFKTKYRVITIDLPGNGLSGTKEPEHSMEFMADVLASVLKQLKVDKATIVGHSMGGYVALAFAEKYDNLVEKLCLFHSSPNPDTEEKKQNRDREIALIESDKLLLLLNTSIKNMFSEDNERRMQESITMIIENATISDPNGIIVCLRGMKSRKDMNPFLASFSKPLLMIFGEKDQYILKESALELIQKYQNANVVMLENSGHAGFLEEPETSAQKLIDFIG